ncbi:MAG: hypothetical protein JOY59_07385 [Candidatus Eremiobacteraeota bacterium]|nr:hypothetical protein [Candidatus Eremiobacteraeota bacterium]
MVAGLTVLGVRVEVGLRPRLSSAGIGGTVIDSIAAATFASADACGAGSGGGAEVPTVRPPEHPAIIKRLVAEMAAT